MSPAPNVDGVLIQWGDRLFYPGNRIVSVRPQPKLSGLSARQRAAAIRQRIEATVVRHAPQVMVKVTGGGRCMKAIAAHLRYISKNGRLDIEDERGETMCGREAVRELADDWRFGGTLIDDVAEPGQRREAFNIMLSMPRGTDPLAVQRAAREFADIELADHKLVMVLHEHQANPHVHLSVRAESRHGQRLNPRKADLHRWRETFAEQLRVQSPGAHHPRPGRRSLDADRPGIGLVDGPGRCRVSALDHVLPAADASHPGIPPDGQGPREHRGVQAPRSGPRSLMQRGRQSPHCPSPSSPAEPFFRRPCSGTNTALSRPPMATLQLDPNLPPIAPEQSLTGWHHELCFELLGDGAARIWARAVEVASFKATELQRAVLFHRLDRRFTDLAGRIDALRPEVDGLVNTARRVQPGKDNLFTTVEYDRNAWGRVEQAIDLWVRQPK